MSVNVTEPKVARSLPFGAPNPLFLRDEELTRGIELLEAAHRALLARPDRRLTERASAATISRSSTASAASPGSRWSSCRTRCS